MYQKISAENLVDPRLKYDYPPAQEKQFKIFTFPSMGNHQLKTSILILQHSPPTKLLRRSKVYHTTLFHHITYYSLKLIKIQIV